MHSSSFLWTAFWLRFLIVAFEHAGFGGTIKLAVLGPFRASTVEPETLALASVGVFLFLVASRIRRRRPDRGKFGSANFRGRRGSESKGLR